MPERIQRATRCNRVDCNGVDGAGGKLVNGQSRALDPRRERKNFKIWEAT
jgi:hypothetical protein